jgi:hypothetical protein
MGKDGVKQPSAGKRRRQVDVTPEAVVWSRCGFQFWNDSALEHIGEVVDKDQ